MTEAKNGDKVRVHFTGRLVDGTVFGSTLDEEPFEFTIGDKNMLPGFENAVIGMQKGETKTIYLAPDEAYGPHKKELVHIMERSTFPQEIEIEIGKMNGQEHQGDHRGVYHKFRKERGIRIVRLIISFWPGDPVLNLKNKGIDNVKKDSSEQSDLEDLDHDIITHEVGRFIKYHWIFEDDDQEVDPQMDQ